VVFIDELMVKIRDALVANRPVYLAIGIDCDGAKNVLGLWVGPAVGESSEFCAESRSTALTFGLLGLAVFLVANGIELSEASRTRCE
jgi:transposase-like protein